MPTLELQAYLEGIQTMARKYKSVSLNRYVYALLHQVGEDMTRGMKPKSIPEIITILAETYQLNNIILPKQWEKEINNEI